MKQTSVELLIIEQLVNAQNFWKACRNKRIVDNSHIHLKILDHSLSMQFLHFRPLDR